MKRWKKPDFLPRALAAHKRLDRKVRRLLRPLGANLVDQALLDQQIARRRVTAALEELVGKRKARDLAYHLLDWNEGMLFLVALALFPKKFRASEIQTGIGKLLAHMPDHTAAAAKLWGTPIRDTFKLGVLRRDRNDA